MLALISNCCRSTSVSKKYLLREHGHILIELRMTSIRCSLIYLIFFAAIPRVRFPASRSRKMGRKKTAADNELCGRDRHLCWVYSVRRKRSQLRMENLNLWAGNSSQERQNLSQGLSNAIGDERFRGFLSQRDSTIYPRQGWLWSFG